MKVAIFILCVLCPFMASAEVLTGTARNNRGDVLYVERHDIQTDDSGLNTFIRVEYSRPDGTLFATMTSDFKNNANLPDTVFEDKRFNLKTTIRIVENAVEFEELKDSKRILSKTIPINGAMVASQGFDNFIRLNSDKIAMQPFEFKFGVLEKKDFYSLTGYKRSASSADEVEYGIRASSWFVRLFAEELRIVYDAKKMRLKMFAGRSNIVDDSGRAQDVIINYEWTGRS